MRPRRPAARLLVIDPAGRLLLFRFTAEGRPPFWCTPGGAVDPGETFEEAARRELREETGMACPIGPHVATVEATFVTLEDVEVDAEERFFLVHADDCAIRVDGHTELERRVMLSHRWWTPDELARCDELFFPANLIDLWQAELAKGADPAPGV